MQPLESCREAVPNERQQTVTFVLCCALVIFELKPGDKMAGYYVDIKKKTKENKYFREVVFTSQLIQLVVMSLEPGEAIGLETYLDTDQFICVEEGSGQAILDGLGYELEPGSAIVISAGTEYNIVNTSLTKAMKLYTVYIPPDYAGGTIHKTKSESAP
jgi:mannose-6-phosphate isomerase-like protein (cupin superfamily)